MSENEITISLRQLKQEIEDGFKEALRHSTKKGIEMPDSHGNQTILDQILLELRALQTETSERLLFIEKRLASIDAHGGFFSDAWLKTANEVKGLERRMVDLERKLTQ